LKGGGPASNRFRRLRAATVTLGVIVILAFAASSAYDAWRAYDNALIATERELGGLAKALAGQTALAWEGIDLLLRDTAGWYRSTGGKFAPARLNEDLATRTTGLGQVRLLTIVDAQGIQRYRSRGSSPPNFDVSDRSYFTAQRDHATVGLFVSEALVTRSENRPGIILSRRLENEAGGFAGVVTASLDFEDLERLFAALSPGEGSAIQLLREDGTLLVRNPPLAAAPERKFAQLLAGPSVQVKRLLNPVDGKRDFIAIARVNGTPLAIAVSRDEAIALHSWRDEATRLGLRTLVVTVLGVLAIGGLSRQLGRIESGERALRESEERYALAMEGANEGHWDWDAVTDRLFISPKMRTWAGLKPELEITTRTEWLARIIVHPDDLSRFQATTNAHLEGRTPRYECEYRLRQPDGGWRWVRARGHCLRDSAGKALRFVGSVSDITAEKQAQQDKEHLEAQLRQSQKMEAMGTLAGGIAHDFNNILGAILGYGELAYEKSVPGTPLQRYLENVLHAAGRAKTLVERILGFSRSGLGERVPVNVQAVIEETLELLTASLPAGIRLRTKLEASDVAVIGDATYLHQVAMNLCTNAIHSMERGGVLEVCLERLQVAEQRALSRGVVAPGSFVRLLVSDTGTGIAPAVMERLFDPFFTTKGVGKGTGLGLSLVHGIVAELGGAINVVTSAGRGSTFEIWLPVVDDGGKRLAASATQPPRGHGETVMIVDDEAVLVALAMEMLAQIGYEPVGFESSSAALQALRAQPQRFDLLLTDEAMPDLTGAELAREIRKIRSDLPILIMTGHGGAQLAEKAAAVGAKEVLRKPLRGREIAEALARVLPYQS
jgi:PAS domain S-box-containing protein